jgi:hypothetical protein
MRVMARSSKVQSLVNVTCNVNEHIVMNSWLSFDTIKQVYATNMTTNKRKWNGNDKSSVVHDLHPDTSVFVEHAQLYLILTFSLQRIFIPMSWHQGCSKSMCWFHHGNVSGNGADTEGNDKGIDECWRMWIESTEKKRWRTRQKDRRRNISTRWQSRASFWVLAKKSATPKIHHVERNGDKHHGPWSISLLLPAQYMQPLFEVAFSPFRSSRCI